MYLYLYLYIYLYIYVYIYIHICIYIYIRILKHTMSSNDCLQLHSFHLPFDDDDDDDDDVYFIKLQHVGYKNLYPYRPAKTTKVQNQIKIADIYMTSRKQYNRAELILHNSYLPYICININIYIYIYIYIYVYIHTYICIYIYIHTYIYIYIYIYIHIPLLGMGMDSIRSSL
jgi:hypothetical protein